jgi:hypothetical protein
VSGARIRSHHPLTRFFADLAPKEYPADHEVAAYVADRLMDLVHADHLYRIRNACGKRLEEVCMRGGSSASGR